MRFYKIRYRRYADRKKDLYSIGNFYVYDEDKESAIKRFLTLTDVRKSDIIEVIEIL